MLIIGFTDRALPIFPKVLGTLPPSTMYLKFLSVKKTLESLFFSSNLSIICSKLYPSSTSSFAYMAKTPSDKVRFDVSNTKDCNPSIFIILNKL